MKYRIWDKEEKKYTEEVFVNHNGKLCFYTSHIGFDYYDVEYFECDNYIVELSTGLFDKNGKEIYEGDIIQHYAFDLDDTFVVKWYEEDACFDGDGSTREWRDCEVVGNINEEDNE